MFLSFHWKNFFVTIDQSRLNYEEQNQHKIRIQFSNQSDLIEKLFWIYIEDINEPPYHLQCSNQTGFCTALDEDFNQTLKFNINNIHNLENEIEFQVICTDDGQPPLSVSTWIRVLPDNMTLMFVPILSLIIPVDDDNRKIDKQRRENLVILYSNDGDNTERQRRQANSPPQDIYFNIYYLSVPENSRDFHIANVYVVDEENDNYTCTVYTNDLPEDHQPFEITNGTLRTSLTVQNNNYDLDFETVSAYNITVTCYDPIHDFRISKNFSIALSDVNEAPVELTLTSNILPENSPAGYIIGQLQTVDPDLLPVNQTFQYTILTDQNHMFTLEKDQLILTRDNDVAMCISQPGLCPHDYEQIKFLFIRISVEDYGEPRTSQKFWIEIKITDENDPPVNLQLNENIVKENSPIGMLIGSFSVDDQDLYQIQTYQLLQENPLSSNGNLFVIEDNALHLARSPDYEQGQYVLITIKATDNGTIPKNITSDFLIEVIDIDELPNTYAFISYTDHVIPNDTINDLINRKQPIQTFYFPRNAYFQPTLEIGKIVFLIEDRNRDMNLKSHNDTDSNELSFSKPTCNILTEVPYRLICTSIVTVTNPSSVDDNDNDDGHLVVTQLKLISNNKTKVFPKSLRLKFENITLTINDKPMESIDIPKDNSTGFLIGPIHAVDLATNGQPVANVTLNPNRCLSYPVEIVNSTILKIRDDVNLSSSYMPSVFNVSILVTTTGNDSRTTEKHLIVYVKDKNDFHLTLSNNKIMENSHENTYIGNFILDNEIGNYTLDLINDANGRFILTETNLLTTEKSNPHCRENHTCSLNYEQEPIINITVAIRDLSTNKTLRLVTFPIKIENENESPYNLTLSAQSLPENTSIGSTVGIVNAIDEDFNQTLTYTIDNPSFTIIDNRLILTTELNYDKQQFISIIIRATDNGQPSIFTEKMFILNVTTVNRPPINVLSTLMTVYVPQTSENTNSTAMVIGEIRIIDPDVKENFTIKLNQPTLRALSPALNSHSILSDDGSVIYAQIYNVSIIDLNPPDGEEKVDYLVNVTANITDSGNHSISHEFFVHYVSRLTTNFTEILPILSTTTTTPSLSQALHIRIYEKTPGNTPIARGLLSSSSSNNSLPNTSTCTAIDDQDYSFPINTTHSNQSAFIILLPNNYTLNSTTRPTFLLNVQCNIANGIDVDQDIIFDVLPAPPTVQINFNQTTTNNINNDPILGTLYLIELTTTPTNRTYNLSLINNQDIFKLLPNGTLIQIGLYQPFINLTIQAIETTPNEPTRIIQTTFPLTITYSILLDPCLNKDCGNGTCIRFNQSSSYCLCTSGYKGIGCRTLDSCAFNPCFNNALCHQLSSEGDFVCQCLPTHSGSRCEIPIDVCQLNISSCPSTDICITIYNNLTNFFTCIPRDELQYLVFDYLNDYKNIEVVNDENLPKKIQDFIKTNLLPIENIILPERRKLGPYKYDRAELVSVAAQTSNENTTTLNNSLEIFCTNQSLIMDSFAREICSGYQQAIYLERYFQSTPSFCPNCTFVDAADKYYWFDKTIPFFPLWLTLIIGSILMAAIPLIPFDINAPKKVVLPLMKAKMKPEDEEENAVLIKSVRSAVKFSRYSYRERNDSGYESNEDIDNYLEQIITNYQDEQQYHVYPVLHGPRSPSIERRGTIIDDSISPSSRPTATSLTVPRRSIQRSASMSTQKYGGQSSVGHSQTLKPIIQRRSTLLNSSLGALIGLTGTPRLNNEDETYLSTKFRNENTSKFVIGTLWNTFALVNNLFLQRSRKRRNAVSDETNIRANQLVHLQELYSLAEHDQVNDISTNNLQSIISNIISESRRNPTDNLQSTTSDKLSPRKDHPCTCYGNDHISSCIYYDHSLPYSRSFNRNISQLERIFNDIQQITNKPHRQDAATQSYLEKPARIFTHFKPTNNVATQSSPILSSDQFYHHISTQCSPIETINNKTISTELNSKEIIDENNSNINISTQTIENNNDDNFVIRSKPKPHNDHIYVNVSTQSSPIVVEDMSTLFPSEEIKDASTKFTPKEVENVPTQFTSEQMKDTKTKNVNISMEFNPRTIETNKTNIHDHRNSLMNELKQVLSSSMPEEQATKEKKSPPSHTVRSLVSMFETTAPKKSNVVFRRKSSPKLVINNSKVLTPPLNIGSKETQSSPVHDTIETYANEIASNIVDCAVSTAKRTMADHNERQQRRFSFYKNAGGHGKSLLFRSNTFVPPIDIVNQEEEENANFRAVSQTSSTLLNDPLTSTVPITTENDSQHTLIVGRHVDGENSTKKSRSLTTDKKFDSSSSLSSSLNDEQMDHRHFLSSSQLFSAQQLYIRPWLVRRATAPNIHCLDNNITDTRIETSNTFFTVFPSNHNNNLDLSTRYTCLITILLYLRNVRDEHSNRILYDELDQIEKQFSNSILSPETVHSNVFRTINPDGSKRYRTGLILDINSSDSINRPKILSKQIEWKRVKIVVRRFRKKYQHYKQLMKNDKKIRRNRLNSDDYFKYFDSTSKRRMKKYAKHYAEKL